MKKVNSSCLKAYEYNDTKELRVLLAGKRLYSYLKVPEAIVTALDAAESKGAFYNSNIKGKFSSLLIPTRKEFLKTLLRNFGVLNKQTEAIFEKLKILDKILHVFDLSTSYESNTYYHMCPEFGKILSKKEFGDAFYVLKSAQKNNLFWDESDWN